MTSNKHTYFIGIDVHLSRFTAACLDENLKTIFINDFSLGELIEKLGSINPQIIAVDAPLGLNIGLMDDEHYRSKLKLKSDKHRNKKVSEYELTRRGISLYSSPKDVEGVSGWKSWMGTGLQLFERLKQMGFVHINENTVCVKGLVEVFPHACFTTHAGKLLENKSTETGLQERVQVLDTVGIGEIRKYLTGSKHIISDKLDAVVAAYTAYTVWKGLASFVGDSEEGCIALPVKTVKDKYSRGQGFSDLRDKTPCEPGEREELNSPTYTYKNVDAVVWLKYFVPVGNSPLIYEIINLRDNPGMKITLKIQSQQGEVIDANFEAMKNRVDGIKVVQEDRGKLKSFWGSHGDKNDYMIELISK